MLPLNLSLRRMIRRYIPQIKNKDLDRFDSLHGLRYQLREDIRLLSEQPDINKRMNEDSNRKTAKENKNIIQAKLRRESLETITIEITKTIKPELRKNFKRVVRLYIARRRLSIQQGSYQEFPTNRKQLINLISVTLKYYKILVETLPGLLINRTKSQLKPLIAILVIFVSVPLISGVVNHGPEVSTIPNQSILEGESFSKIPLDDFVVDKDDPDADISWSYSGNDNLTIFINPARLASVTAKDSNWNGIETIYFTATDPMLASDSDSVRFEIQSVNDAPNIISVPPLHSKVNVLYSYQVFATDADDEDTVRFFLDSPPLFLRIDSVSGMISGIPHAADSGLYKINVIAEDTKAAKDKQIFCLTVK